MEETVRIICCDVEHIHKNMNLYQVNSQVFLFHSCTAVHCSDSPPGFVLSREATSHVNVRPLSSAASAYMQNADSDYSALCSGAL